ncbi:MAG: helicase-associated domain-containing protein [Thermoplasmata archaeon]
MEKVMFKAGKLYTLTEILSTVSDDYFLEIEKTVLKPPWNKKSMDNVITEYRLQRIFDKITQKDYFFRSVYDIYSINQSLFRFVTYLGGTVEAAIMLDIPDFRENVHRYLGNNLLFAIPSPESPVFYVVPAEYIILASSRNATYRFDYEADDLPSCLNNYDETLLNIIASTFGFKKITKALQDVSRLYASIANDFAAMLSSLSNAERTLLRKLYNRLGVLSYVNLIDSRDRYPGIPVSAFLDRLKNDGQTDQVSLITKGITCLVCSTRGTTSGTVVISTEFIRKIREYLGIEVHLPTREGEVPLHDFKQPYEKMISILLATEFLERVGKKHDSNKIAQVTHIPVQIIDILLNVAHNKLWVDGPRTRYHLTENGKTIMDWSESSKTKLMNALQNAYWTNEETGYMANLQLPSSRLYSIIDGILEKKQLFKASEIIDLVLDNTSVFEESRKQVFERSRQSWYHSENEHEREMLKSPWEYFRSIYQSATFEYLQALYIAGKINMSSDDVTPDTYIRKSGNPDENPKNTKIINQTSARKTDGKVSLLPNYEMLVEPYLPIDDIMYIAELSELISIDQVIVTRITKASLVRYLNTFGNSAGIIPRLEKLCGTRLPQNVVTLINDVGEKENEVSLLSSQYVLSAKDSSIINDLANNKELSKYFGKRITETTAIIKHGISKDRIISAVKKRGYVVHAEKAEEDAEYRKPKGRRRFY